jgi:hypothetical protein
MSFFRNALLANFQKLQLNLILTVARQIWQILQISAVFCRTLQIPRGSANSKPKFYSKNLAKVCSRKNLTIYSLGLHQTGIQLNFFRWCGDYLPR